MGAIEEPLTVSMVQTWSRMVMAAQKAVKAMEAPERIVRAFKRGGAGCGREDEDGDGCAGCGFERAD